MKNLNKMKKEKLITLVDNGFNISRMFGSKSAYRHTHPKDDIMFNSNIFTPSSGKIWDGDLNITKDCTDLQKACDEIGEQMIVVSEMCGRFGAEDRPYDEILNDAHVIFEPNSDSYMKRIYDGLESKELGNMTVVKSKGIAWNVIKLDK
jgi:hypothetical protein